MHIFNEINRLYVKEIKTANLKYSFFECCEYFFKSLHPIRQNYKFSPAVFIYNYFAKVHL